MENKIWVEALDEALASANTTKAVVARKAGIPYRRIWGLCTGGGWVTREELDTIQTVLRSLAASRPERVRA